MAEQKWQKQIFDDFTASLMPEVEKCWMTRILEWERDLEKPNPYVAIVTHACLSFVHRKDIRLIFCLDASQDEVNKQLLQEEIATVKAGIPQLHVMGPTAFISLVLLVEENQ